MLPLLLHESPFPPLSFEGILVSQIFLLILFVPFGAGVKMRDVFTPPPRGFILLEPTLFQTPEQKMPPPFSPPAFFLAGEHICAPCFPPPGSPLAMLSDSLEILKLQPLVAECFPQCFSLFNLLKKSLHCKRDLLRFSPPLSFYSRFS